MTTIGDTQGSKTLSKASLYAPLAAYNHGDPALFMRTKRLTSSTQESSLIEFLGTVSQNYHRSSSTKQPKNTANRPVSAQEINDKLQQRALTLVTGGINAKVARFNNTNKPAPSRKRQRSDRIKRKDEVKWLNDLPRAMRTTQADFLEQMNQLWNNYIRRLLRCKDFATNTGAYSQRIQKVSAQIEWIGGRMRLDECTAHPKWTGRQGILVSERSQTWKLIEVARKGGDVNFDVLVVPKKGSLLTAFLQMSTVDAKTGSEGAERKTVCLHLRASDEI